MTLLDQFEPDGEPIHPYDFYVLLEAANYATVEIGTHSPPPEDDVDYLRNRTKIGRTISVDGKLYFESTAVPYNTNRFDTGLASYYDAPIG